MRRMLGKPRQRLVANAMRFCAASPQPPPGPNSRADMAALVAAMENDPELIKSVVNNMPPEARRRLVVTGAAYEWFGADSVASEMKKADANMDRDICPKDFDKWFEEALRRKTATADTAEASATPGSCSATSSSFPDGKIPFRALALVALEAGLPFVGFGFLDNATMILAGDAIDRSVGFYLNCSVMASAAMGNIVSGCMGMQVHGFVEKLIQKCNLPVPHLTDDERRSQPVFIAGHVGGTLGIALGLTIGLIPLYFIADEDEKNEHKAFHQLDLNHDGTISHKELMTALIDLGIPLPEEAARAVTKKFGTDDRLSFDQFRELCQHVRKYGSICEPHKATI